MLDLLENYDFRKRSKPEVLIDEIKAILKDNKLNIE